MKDMKESLEVGLFVGIIMVAISCLLRIGIVQAIKVFASIIAILLGIGFIILLILVIFLIVEAIKK